MTGEGFMQRILLLIGFAFLYVAFWRLVSFEFAVIVGIACILMEVNVDEY